MKKINENSLIKQFFFDLSHLKDFIHSGGYFEVAIDFTSAQYFDVDEQLDDLVQFATEKANAGHQVFFGPAPRKKDSGPERSDMDNVLGSYSFWVDIDPPDKKAPLEQKLADSRRLLDEFVDKLNGYGIRPSYIVESGHGYHIYFLLKKFFEFPNHAWPRVEDALTRLAKGDTQVCRPGSLLRVPGTFNFKDRDNPLPVRIIERDEVRYDIEDFRQLFMDMTQGANAKQEDKRTRPVSGGGKLGFTPPCIASMLDPANKPPEGHRHLVRQILSTFAFHEGWALEDAIQKVAHTTDDPKKAERDVEGVYKVLERDPGRYSVGCGEGSDLRNLVEAGVAVCDEQNCRFKNPKATKGDDKNEEMSAWFDGLVEIVSDDTGKIEFLIKDGSSFVAKDKLETDENIKIPPPSSALVWIPPRKNNVTNYVTGDNDQRLFADLVEYHKGISELPDDSHYRFLAAWDMHTYLIEKFECSPVLWLHGIPARGKTRTAKGITYVSWRGIIQNTIKEAHVIRLATYHRATLFFDIADFWKKVERAGADDIMLNRFEKGGRVQRVFNPDLGPFKDSTWFEIYGPTILATNKAIDPIMETRSVLIVMPETNRTFENDVKERDSLPLRERLTAFRARWMNRGLPAVNKPVSGRLGDILRPIRQIVNIACSNSSWFMDFAKQQEDLRKRESADTDDARVVNAIIQSLDKVVDGHLLHRDVLSVLNAGLADQFKMTAQKLGRITKSLGFRGYSSGSLRGIVVNPQLLNLLCYRYGIQQGGDLLTM